MLSLNADEVYKLLITLPKPLVCIFLQNYIGRNKNSIQTKEAHFLQMEHSNHACYPIYNSDLHVCVFVEIWNHNTVEEMYKL